MPETGCRSRARTCLPLENDIIASLALPQTVIAQQTHILLCFCLITLIVSAQCFKYTLISPSEVHTKHILSFANVDFGQSLRFA